jgi:hypothetical protein
MEEFKLIASTKGGLVCDLVLPKRDPDTGCIYLVTFPNVKLCPYLLLVTGDTQGQDVFCSVCPSKIHAKQLCRICDTPRDSTGNPRYAFLPKLAVNIKKTALLARDGNEDAIEEMKQLSVYATKNAFWEDVPFFDSSSLFAGIYGVVPPELMHYIQHGVFDYSVACFFDQSGEAKTQKKKKKKKTDTEEDDEEGGDTKKKKNKKKKKKDTEEDEEEGDEGDDVEGIVKGRRVIPKSKLPHVNAMAKAVGKLLAHSSDEMVPRMVFPHGVTSKVHKSCADMTGVVLHMLILLTTDCGKKIADIKVEERRRGWVKLIERLLLYEQFMRCTEPKLVSDVKKCNFQAPAQS